MGLCESCEHAWLNEACLLAVIVNGSGNDYIRNLNCVQSIWNSTKKMVLEVKLVGCFGGDGTVTGKRTADYCYIELRYILMRTMNL